MLSPSTERAPLPTEGQQSASTPDTMGNGNPEHGPESGDSSLTEPDQRIVNVGNADVTTSQIVYEATFCEVDEKNIIRALHTNKAGELRTGTMAVPAILTSDPEKAASNQGMTWRPIMQRGHRDVAIGVDKLKRPVIIHDLADESNTGVMIVHEDQAVIQGHHEEVRSTIAALLESQEEDSSLSLFVSIRDVYGEAAARQRQAGRHHSLVDICGRYKLMEREHAERLMDKDWADPAFKDLVVAELRPADPSPIGALKEGRRLIPIEPEEDSVGLRQAQFGRATEEQTGPAEAQVTGYMEVLANKTWFGQTSGQ
ncbi:hypothetical protein F4810DRAFT_706811 [Camillea tinctor]|nr:hypothetical protein F4810DRAFT_706811 [Camillea tinctor]